MLKANGKTTTIQDYRQYETEKCIFADSWAVNYQKIVNNLKQLRKDLPRFSRRVAVSIPDEWVIYQLIQTDSLFEGLEKQAELAHELTQLTHIPHDQLSLDFIVNKNDLAINSLCEHHSTL
ncbi:pilus assembly protein PilM [Vibrio sonorensis]|uniref:pilus assembly protein PilM n=1 Tax=Vibrio sonorensis TaxID=1004316 RepID=UPI0008D8DE48|nr:pilus assembly protein PilM [Vibrio sonorensis]